MTPVSDYYIIAGVIYQAPDLGSVLNSRILTGVGHLQKAFEEAREYSRYHPSRGYWWDFGKDKEEKKKQVKEKKEEPSSLFQRRRVDMLLDQLTRQYPHKYASLLPAPAPPESEPAMSVKSEAVASSTGAGAGVKRNKPADTGGPANKKIKSER